MNQRAKRDKRARIVVVWEQNTTIKEPGQTKRRRECNMMCQVTGDDIVIAGNIGYRYYFCISLSVLLLDIAIVIVTIIGSS